IPHMVSQGLFRQDLFMRRDYHLHLPPLREIPEQIPVIVENLVRGIHAELERKRKAVAFPELDPGAVAFLAQQPWKGNVRELKNFLQRLFNFASKQGIQQIDRAIAQTRYQAVVGGKVVLGDNQTGFEPEYQAQPEISQEIPIPLPFALPVTGLTQAPSVSALPPASQPLAMDQTLLLTTLTIRVEQLTQVVQHMANQGQSPKLSTNQGHKEKLRQALTEAVGLLPAARNKYFTPTEMSILSQFLTNPNKTMRRSTLGQLFPKLQQALAGVPKAQVVLNQLQSFVSGGNTSQ
ncbi:MAG: hypothetical protein K1Y36_26125, partial [Blastocatellia bacterium]|nr:hypothetical protein [Blastocatellia bacterium]